MQPPDDMLPPVLLGNFEEFVKSCWECLCKLEQLPPPTLTGGTVATPLEAVLITALAHARLKNHSECASHCELADEGATRVFCGALSLNDVSPDLWDAFTARVEAIRRACTGA